MVEGNKILREILDSPYIVKEVFSTDLEGLDISTIPTSLISAQDLKKISFLQNPKNSLALCELPQEIPFVECDKQIILDGIQDPGNLGTIIRLADWFGIKQIICSEDTVDYLNPKVLMASMGSFTRVRMVYKDLTPYLKNSTNQNIGTDMNGENIYNFQYPEKFNLIFGNEGNGMRAESIDQLQNKITIPQFGSGKNTESLNVSMAAGIILSQIFSTKKSD